MEPIAKFIKMTCEPTFSFDTSSDDSFRYFVIGLEDIKIKLKLLAFSIEDIQKREMWSVEHRWGLVSSEYVKRTNDLRDQNTLLTRITGGVIEENVTAYFDRTRVTISPENIVIESDNFCVVLPHTSKIRKDFGDALRCALTEIESEDC